MPYVCPVCRGRGLVQTDFYLPPTLGISPGTEPCRTCAGRGVARPTSRGCSYWSLLGTTSQGRDR